MGILEFRPSEHCARAVGDNLRHMINQEQGWVYFVVRRVLPA